MSGDDIRASWPRGLKKTRQRLLVLEVLEASPLPLTAAQVEDMLRSRETPLWPATIYRTLDCFVQSGMLTKTAVVETGQAVYELVGPHHRHYAVCVDCHRVIPLKNCPLEHLRPELQEQDFQVLGHQLQMFGRCSLCQHNKRGEG